MSLYNLTITDLQKSFFEAMYNILNETITIKSTITKLIGTKPIIIITGESLYSGKDYIGAYNKVIGFDVEWLGPQIYVGQSHSETYSVTSTNFRMTLSITTAG